MAMLLNAMFLNPDGFQPQLLLLLIGASGLLIGFLWIRRITSPDEGPSPFRYRRHERLDEEWPTWRWTFTRAAMMFARVSLIVSVLAFFGGQGPRAMVRGSEYHGLATVIALAGLVIGNIWIHRIYRANPEPDSRAWRYRR
jgi:drug/metabolite transporter (DMT)-like permease